MAISVDTVYKTVLLILNNEQRGYMTPDEFNKIGTQVQRKIFERYFEDLNQQVRIPQSDMEYSDRVAITDEKISEFKKESQAINLSDNIFSTPVDLYRLGSLTLERPGFMPVEVQRVGRSEFYNIRKSPLTSPTESKPIYIYEDNKVILYPNIINNNVFCQYVGKPKDVRWGYKLGVLGQYSFTDYDFDETALLKGNFDFQDLDIQSNITPSASVTEPPSPISPSNTTGVGSGATFLISVSTNISTSLNEITGVEVVETGSGYQVGDTLTFNASIFGAPTGSNNFSFLLSENNFMRSTQQGKTDFQLHNSEQTEVVLNILSYSGIIIGDPGIVQVATQKIQQEEVNEKS